MRPRMMLTLLMLVSGCAEVSRADDGFPPWLTRQRSTWASLADNQPSGVAPVSPTPMQTPSAPREEIIQSSYHVPSSPAAPCAPQANGLSGNPAGVGRVQVPCAPQSLPSPGVSRVCQPHECPPPCPPYVAQPQGAPLYQGVSQAAPQAAPGMFAAPQGRGEISGESHSLGIRGFAIRIPEIHLEFPTIQLPSLIRFRREPEMRMEAAHAPYVTGMPAVYGQLAPGGMAQAVPAVPAPPAYSQAQALQYVPKTPCPPPSSSQSLAPSPQSGAASGAPGQDQTLRQELAEKEQVIRDLQLKLQKLHELEQSLHQLSSQHRMLMQEIKPAGSVPACPPASGRSESINPRNPLVYPPAPAENPFAPPATDPE